MKTFKQLVEKNLTEADSLKANVKKLLSITDDIKSDTRLMTSGSGLANAVKDLEHAVKRVRMIVL